MDLDQIDAGAVGTPCGRNVGRHETIHIAFIHGPRRVAAAHGIGRRADHLDARLQWHGDETLPGCCGRGFAPGMLELDANRGAAGADGLGQRAESLALLVIPQAEIGIG